jgi:3-oxoadipate enol-lactonase
MPRAARHPKEIERMPSVPAGDIEIHYELEGTRGAPVLVLAHPLGTDLSVWEPQREALAAPIGQLADDALALLDALAIERVHFCGLSIGGLVGISLGAGHGERLRRLALCNTARRIGSAETWNARIEAVRRDGLAGLAPGMMERWFTAAFRAREPQVVARTRAILEATPVEGYLASCAAIRDVELSAEAARIATPTLVIAGRDDPSTPPDDGRALAGAIPGARYVELPAAHLSNLEAASTFTAELNAFLA